MVSGAVFVLGIVKKFWDPESEIRKNSFRIRIPGVKKHRIPDPQHWPLEK
jgi:hypothetical protein